MTADDTAGEHVDALEPLLSVDEVTQLLRVSESSLYRLVRSGVLARVKVGGRTLFEPRVVRDFIAGCRDLGGVHQVHAQRGVENHATEVTQHA